MPVKSLTHMAGDVVQWQNTCLDAQALSSVSSFSQEGE
jgi:hypothetical protein